MNPELKVRINGLLQVIHEGDMVEQFLGQEAWAIIKRTLKAQEAVYEDEAFDAARHDDKEIKNFLGRLEAVKWVISTIEESFMRARDGAVVERSAIQDEAKEEEDLDSGVKDHMDLRSYEGTSPGLV